MTCTHVCTVVFVHPHTAGGGAAARGARHALVACLLLFQLGAAGFFCFHGSHAQGAAALLLLLGTAALVLRQWMAVRRLGSGGGDMGSTGIAPGVSLFDADMPPSSLPSFSPAAPATPSAKEEEEEEKEAAALRWEWGGAASASVGGEGCCDHCPAYDDPYGTDSAAPQPLVAPACAPAPVRGAAEAGYGVARPAADADEYGDAHGIGLGFDDDPQGGDAGLGFGAMGVGAGPEVEL